MNLLRSITLTAAAAAAMSSTAALADAITLDASKVGQTINLGFNAWPMATPLPG